MFLGKDDPLAPARLDDPCLRHPDLTFPGVQLVHLSNLSIFRGVFLAPQSSRVSIQQTLASYANGGWYNMV